MNTLPKKLRTLGAVLSLASLSLGVALPGEAASAFQSGDWVAVSDEQLESLRGGFDLGQGLTVSFGIVRTVTINGDLVSRTSFQLPDVSRITAEQFETASAAIAAAGIVQNGPGNSVAASFASGFPSATVIQNTLDNQNIQNLTTINASVNSLELFKAINTQTVLNEALLGSMQIR